MDGSPPGSSVHGILWHEYWSGLPFPSLGDHPDPGIKPRSCTLQADSLPSEPPMEYIENVWQITPPGCAIWVENQRTRSQPLEKWMKEPSRKWEQHVPRPWNKRWRVIYSGNREKTSDPVTQCECRRGAGINPGEAAGAISCSVGSATVWCMDIISVLQECTEIGKWHLISVFKRSHCLLKMENIMKGGDRTPVKRIL